jgi:polysaccharide biosynthesis protein PslH
VRILWVKTSPLHPLTRGGDLRTYHMLRWLNRWHEVTFLGLTANRSQKDYAKLSYEYSAHSTWVDCWRTSPSLPRPLFLAGAGINLFSRLPYAVSRFRSSRLKFQIEQLLKSQPFDLLVCDFLFPAASLPWNQKQVIGIPWILFQHNVESMIWKRRTEGRAGLSGHYWRNQWGRMKKFERDVCHRFDGVITVSEADTLIHRKDYGLGNVLGSVPTGVDIDYFASFPRTLPEVPTIVFVGSMDWLANVDAVLHFAKDSWPLIRQKLPNARFLIVGREPPASVRNLAGKDDGIEVTGTVPDIRPYMRNAHGMVVPLRIGGGTRLKILEAMAAGLPVVSTQVGAEGLPVKHGHHLLLADDPENLANSLLQIMKCHELANQLSSAAFKEIANANSWEVAAREFESLITGITGTSPETGTKV